MGKAGRLVYAIRKVLTKVEESEKSKCGHDACRSGDPRTISCHQMPQPEAYLARSHRGITDGGEPSLHPAVQRLDELIRHTEQKHARIMPFKVSTAACASRASAVSLAPPGPGGVALDKAILT